MLFLLLLILEAVLDGTKEDEPRFKAEFGIGAGAWFGINGGAVFMGCCC